MEISLSECPDFPFSKGHIALTMGKFEGLYEIEACYVSYKLLVLKVQRSWLCRSCHCFIQNKPAENFTVSMQKPSFSLPRRKKMQATLSLCRCTPKKQDLSSAVASPRLYTLRITLLCFYASGQQLNAQLVTPTFLQAA